MRIDGRTRLLGVIGEPIAHSLSPRIHNHGLSSLGENLVYLPFEIMKEDLAGFLRLFPRIGGIGLNVTTPYKEAVAEIVHAGDDEVACTGCCNTITYRDSLLTGWSTDGSGFCLWMEEQRIQLQEQRVVLLGFGATARSLTYHLAAVCRLTIVTRRPEEVERILGSCLCGIQYSRRLARATRSRRPRGGSELRRRTDICLRCRPPSGSDGIRWNGTLGAPGRPLPVPLAWARGAGRPAPRRFGR